MGVRHHLGRRDWGGIIVGAFLGWALVMASSSATLGLFFVAPAQLVVLLLAGAFAGILAGIRPARRAARLDILTATAAD
jgi:putative ABC transport system permease protein